jgi:hypothetical protein
VRKSSELSCGASSTSAGPRSWRALRRRQRYQTARRTRQQTSQLRLQRDQIRLVVLSNKLVIQLASQLELANNVPVPMVYKQSTGQKGRGWSDYWVLPCTTCIGGTTAPPRRRGAGPHPTTSFKYNLRRRVPTNSPVSPARHTLVSKGAGLSLPAMSTTSVAGSGSGKDSEKDVTLADVVRRLAAIEAIM